MVAAAVVLLMEVALGGNGAPGWHGEVMRRQLGIPLAQETSS